MRYFRIRRLMRRHGITRQQAAATVAFCGR
jgi:hypothetical protein